MKKLINIAVATLLFLFVAKANSTEKKSKIYINYINEIVNNFVKEIEKKSDLICVGDGGSMPYDVQSIGLMFQINKQLSIDEARELEVKAIQRLLALINSHEKIRPYLRDYPFPAKRIEISISINNKKKFSLVNPLHYISQVNGKIRYCTDDLATDRFKEILCEPFEEAVKKVASSSSKTTKESSASTK